jgi:hypothetical protein
MTPEHTAALNGVQAAPGSGSARAASHSTTADLEMVPPYAQYAEVRRLKLAERMEGEVVDEEQIDAGRHCASLVRSWRSRRVASA